MVKTMKIKFAKLPIIDIEGKEFMIETLPPFKPLHQIVGNTLFNIAEDVATHDLGIKIYHEGPDGTELNDKEIELLRSFMPYFKYNLQLAIVVALKMNN